MGRAVPFWRFVHSSTGIGRPGAVLIETFYEGAVATQGARVHKAVIPAAGLGTRFLPATRALAKEMLPLVDRPVIEYAVEEAAGAGIDDFLIVTNRYKAAIEDHFDTKQELEKALTDRGLPLHPFSQVHLHFVRQHRALGLGHAVLLAAAHVGSAPFAVLLPDDVIPGDGPDVSPQCLNDMLRLYHETGRPVVAVRRVNEAQVSQYGVVDIRAGGPDWYNVVDLIEKPAPEDAPSNFAIIGRYVLPDDIFVHLQAQRPGAGGEVQLTDALRALNRQVPMIAYVCPDAVYDVGSKLGYLQAMVELTLQRQDLGPPFAAYLESVLRRYAQAEGIRPGT